jgi:hypothetical protein
MNASNLKSVLAIVANAIAVKAATENEERNKQAALDSKAMNENHAAKRAIVSKLIKSAPIDKSIAIVWRSTDVQSDYSFEAKLSPWAKGLLDKQSEDHRADCEALTEKYAVSTLRFTYGTGSNDYTHVNVGKARRAAYVKLRDEYDALRVSLLMSDDKAAAAAIRAFQAKIGKL